nr:MAG TPA: hypothetical protein [Caudoviricetes sp.]
MLLTQGYYKRILRLVRLKNLENTRLLRFLARTKIMIQYIQRGRKPLI